MWIGCKYDDLRDLWLQSEPEAGAFSVSSTSSNRVCRDQRQNPTSPLGYIADVLLGNTASALRGGEGSNLNYLATSCNSVSKIDVSDRMQLHLRRCRAYRFWGRRRGLSKSIAKAQAKAWMLATAKTRVKTCYPAQSFILVM